MRLTFLSFLAVLLAAVIAGALSICTMVDRQEKLSVKRGDVLHAYEAVDAINRVSISLNDVETDRHAFIASEETHYKDDWQEDVSSLESFSNKLERYAYLSAPAAQHLHRLVASWRQEVDDTSKWSGHTSSQYKLEQFIKVSTRVAELREFLMLARIDEQSTLEKCKAEYYKALSARDREFVWVILGLSGWIAIIGTIPAYFIPKIMAVAAKHKQAEEQLRYSENLFRQLAENIHEVFFVFKSGPELAYVSPAYDDVWGRSRSELSAHPWSLLRGVVKEDRSRLVRFAKSELAHALRSGVEFRVMRPDGSVRWVMLKAFTKFGLNHEYEASYMVAHDITEQKEAESRVNDFFSTVSHELRTPLTSIHASLRLMGGGVAGPLSEKSKQLVSIAVTESDRLIRLINNILDLRKMEAGKLEFKVQENSLARMIEIATGGVEGMADAAGMTIQCVDVPSCSVWCDEDRIVQVLENLLSNAIKFSSNHGSILVSASLGAGGVRISVADHGSGIPDRQISKLFGKFQQLDSSDNRRQGGSGLGLAISKTIVEQHRGKIGVISKEGEGSTFWFELPVVEELMPERSAVLSQVGR